jgi:hypothetical protein
MAQRKRNEVVLGKTMRNMGYYVHKFGDVRYAFCPHCSKMFPLPKAEKKPDFLIAMDYRFVEAKGAGSSWAFFNDFRPNQREFMDNEIKRSWIFVEIGEGNAPAGKKAYLCPWAIWKTTEEHLLQLNYKSLAFERTGRIRVPCIDDALGPYRLAWEKGAWIIPDEHMWNSNELDA